jgi:hypothetical protein
MRPLGRSQTLGAPTSIPVGAFPHLHKTLRAELRMARYFFHLEGRNERIADRRGQILPDDGAALREADRVAAALRTYREEPWRVIVTNEWGHEVTEAAPPLQASA